MLAHYEGDDGSVEEMLAWCREGSPSAEVQRVEVREVEPIGDSSFEVRY